jgi:hypothetical protein
MMGSLADYWPFAALLLVGYLPNEMWRVLGLVLARGLNEDSDLVILSRALATATIAGVVAKLILFSGGALAQVPIGVRVAAAALGFAGYLLARRSVFVGVAVGEAAFLIGGYCLQN